ncbi:MAG: phosphoribosylanthranilate isomerase [Candidatus Brocadiales bacterium]
MDLYQWSASGGLDSIEMVKVKICGITSPGDARTVVDSGADALGFVFAPSPRQVSPARAREIIKRLPPFVTPVGVFVNEEIRKVLDIASYTGLKAVQLHGKETPGYVECLCEFLDSPSLEGCKSAIFWAERGKGEGGLPSKKGGGGRVPHPFAPLRAGSTLPHQGGGNFVSRQFWVIKAIRIRTRRDLAELGKYKADAFLLDSYARGRLGGTGKTFPWELAREARRLGTIVLAGGLNPENVQAAIRTVRPYGVDVSSGVESSPGKKDRRLVKEFIRAAKFCVM